MVFVIKVVKPQSSPRTAAEPSGAVLQFQPRLFVIGGRFPCHGDVRSRRRHNHQSREAKSKFRPPGAGRRFDSRPGPNRQSSSEARRDANVSFQQSASRPNSPGLLHRDPGFETFARMESAIGWAKSPSAAHDMDIDPRATCPPAQAQVGQRGQRP